MPARRRFLVRLRSPRWTVLRCSKACFDRQRFPRKTCCHRHSLSVLQMQMCQSDPALPQRARFPTLCHTHSANTLQRTGTATRFHWWGQNSRPKIERRVPMFAGSCLGPLSWARQPRLRLLLAFALPGCANQFDLFSARAPE